MEDFCRIQVPKSSYLEKALAWLFFISVVLLAFDNVQTLPYVIGELSPVASAWVLLCFIGLFCFGIAFDKIKFKMSNNIISWLLTGFAIVIVLSGIFNLSEILEVTGKGRTGIEKFSKQVILLSLCYMITLAFYNSFKAKGIKWALNFMVLASLVSFVVVIIYSFFEIGHIWGHEWCSKVLAWFDAFFRKVPLDYKNRIRSVCGEGSWFANYLCFVYPMFIYGLLSYKRKSLYYLLIVTIWILSYLSFSRIVYFFVFTETFFIISIWLYLVKAKKYESVLLKKFFFLMVITFAGLYFIPEVPAKDYAEGEKAINVLKSMFPVDNKVTGVDSKNSQLTPELPAKDFADGDQAASVSKSASLKGNKIYKSGSKNYSNMGRIGSWCTAINMGSDRPVLGFGLGQYGFYAYRYVPDWAKNNVEIRSWVDLSVTNSWAPVHNLYARLFAETGLCGVLSWVLIWLVSALKMLKDVIKSQDHASVNIAFCILLAIYGVMVVGMNIDSFRYMQYWIILGMLLIYVEEQKPG